MFNLQEVYTLSIPVVEFTFFLMILLMSEPNL